MQRTSLIAFALGACLLVAAAPAHAADWHRSMDEGLAAAAKSGKPVLLVTLWPPKV